MERRALVDIDIALDVAGAVNSVNEYGGYFLGEVYKGDIHIVGGMLDKGSEFHAGNNIELLQDYIDQVYNNSKLRLINVHSHGCPFGDIVQEWDPYWSVNPELDNLSFPRGSIVDDFYISQFRGNSGDNVVSEYFHENFGSDYHLFAHPAHGSEGEVMDSSKLELTLYKYDSKSIGRVREFPMELK